MRQNGGSIPVPWRHRIRHLLSNQLQGWLFALSVAAVLGLWLRQSPRVIVTGQVEMVRVVVPASRDGMLKTTDPPLARFDRVIQGITPVAHLDVTEALLTMQSLTAERERLQAELESQREQIRQEQLKWQWQSEQQQWQVEQRAIDRQRVRLAMRQVVDQLTADVNDLHQSKRVLAIKRQENQAAIRNAEIEFQSLGEDQKRLERSIAMRMTPATKRDELQQRLKLKEAALQSASQLEQMITREFNQLERQTLESTKRLADAIRESGDRESKNRVTADRPQPVQPFNAQAILRPYVEAIAVQDAKIRVVANQITSNQIVAPASGTIAMVHQSAGTFVKSGDPIVTIASDERRWVVAYLDASDQAKVRENASVQISFASPQSLVTVSSVTERGNHFESVPPELCRSVGTPQWGVPIKVPLPPGVDAVPGQTVRLVIQ
jgi:multidrug resistance efflux pump